MQFSIVMSLVVFISTAVLLYQFWAGSLTGDEPGVVDLGPSQSERPPSNAAVTSASAAGSVHARERTPRHIRSAHIITR